MKIKRRRGIDFRKHELHINSQEGITVHWLKQPNTIVNNVKFINTNGLLVVTGDFGNYVFCRQFIPANGELVSDGYWCEKMQTSSIQNPYYFDIDATEKELKRMVRVGCKEYGYTDERLIKAKQYYGECIDYLDNELDYTEFAYRNMPPFMDYDEVVFIKSVIPRLEIVFDAFEEICRRLK